MLVDTTSPFSSFQLTNALPSSTVAVTVTSVPQAALVVPSGKEVVPPVTVIVNVPELRSVKTTLCPSNVTLYLSKAPLAIPLTKVS